MNEFGSDLLKELYKNLTDVQERINVYEELAENYISVSHDYRLNVEYLRGLEGRLCTAIYNSEKVGNLPSLPRDLGSLISLETDDYDSEEDDEDDNNADDEVT